MVTRTFRSIFGEWKYCDDNRHDDIWYGKGITSLHHYNGWHLFNISYKGLLFQGDIEDLVIDTTPISDGHDSQITHMGILIIDGVDVV